MTDIAPGWYDDGSGRQRWWDGSRWGGDVADLTGSIVELHAAERQAAPAGWYDDTRGRQRWWDGAQWTARWRFSGRETVFAGVVVDGSWIHYGDASQPIAGVMAKTGSGELRIEGLEGVWVAPVAPALAGEAQRFAAWVNETSRHYMRSGWQ